MCSPIRFTRPGAEAATTGRLENEDSNSELASLTDDNRVTGVGISLEGLWGMARGVWESSSAWRRPRWRGLSSRPSASRPACSGSRWTAPSTPGTSASATGSKEGLGADLSSPALGSDLLPVLAPYDTIVQRVTGLGGFRLNLGALTTDAQADVTTAVLGLTLGVTRFIAVFGRLPLARARVQTDLDLDATSANAGLNPGTAAQDPFFAQFDAALSTLEAQIAAGAYDGDPTRRALADATLAQGDALFGDLFTLLGDPAPRRRSSPPAEAKPAPRSPRGSRRSRPRSAPISASADSPPSPRCRPRPRPPTTSNRSSATLSARSASRPASPR